MIAFCALTAREMTVDLAQEVLGELWGEDEKIITIDQIQRRVCDFFGLKMSDLRRRTAPGRSPSRARSRCTSHAR